MANKIILKKSSVASKVPLATDLDVGEIAVNLTDQKLYSKNASGTVIAVGVGTATGTVTGVTATSPVASSGGTAPVISLASGYGDTKNPFASKTANYVLAAPNGVAGAPTFRAIVAADIPTLNQNTTGSSGSCTGNAATATTATTATTANALNTANSYTGAGFTASSGTGKVILGTDAGGSIQLGRTDGVASTPYVDFNSGATAVDYDVRVQASGGNGTSGNGTLAIIGALSATGGYTATSAAPFYLNATTVSANFTVPANYNASSAGPITINTGVTVTVSTGSNWVIV